MLAKHQRVVTAADFKSTVRRGKRFPSKHAVVYVTGGGQLDKERIVSSARFGFIVSKSVGNAVERNRVRRRLRSIAAEYVGSQAIPVHQHSTSGEWSRPGPRQLVVVRVLPGVAAISWASLRSELLCLFGGDAVLR